MNDLAEKLQTTEPPADDAPRRHASRFDWWGEAKGMFWLIIAVLGFHSLLAKPFYIPSESMLPGLEVGDRLVVSKYAYGWSFVSPTIPNPAAIVENVVLRRPVESWSVQLPAWRGRVWGKMPERGDVVIVTPPGQTSDYIKRVIGLPGDTLEVRAGTVILNGKPVERGPIHYRDMPVDKNATCDPWQYPGARINRPDGKIVCRLPIVTETLPNGRRFDTVELGASPGDYYGPIKIPADHVFLMGDNRDRSADSRVLAQVGYVPAINLIAKAEARFFSIKDNLPPWQLWQWPANVRWDRMFQSIDQ